MVEVPVRVDEMGDGIGAESGKSFSDLRARHADAGIDKHFAVRALSARRCCRRSLPTATNLICQIRGRAGGSNIRCVQDFAAIAIYHMNSLPRQSAFGSACVV